MSDFTTKPKDKKGNPAPIQWSIATLPRDKVKIILQEEQELLPMSNADIRGRKREPKIQLISIAGILSVQSASLWQPTWSHAAAQAAMAAPLRTAS